MARMLNAMQRRGNRHADPEPLGRLLTSALRELGLHKRVLEQQAASLWSEAAPERLAQKSTVTGVVRGKLFVYIEGALWREQLTYSKAKIIEKINQKLGTTVIEDIVLARKPGV